jgi:hypothetical protein
MPVSGISGRRGRGQPRRIVELSLGHSQAGEGERVAAVFFVPGRQVRAVLQDGRIADAAGLALPELVLGGVIVVREGEFHGILLAGGHYMQ